MSTLSSLFNRIAPVSGSSFHSFFRVVIASLVSAPLVVRSGPSGATVISGVANVASGGNLTTVTAGNNSVLHWDSFNVAPAQTVQFVQPSESSRVLNWIGGATPSQIDGSLKANGQVYLLNPAGVYFGQTAVVDVAKLYAIGGALSKEDFFAGNDHFTNLTGDVRNEGSLHASTVALIGRTVVNSGTIVSPDGFVALAAGEQVYLRQKGSSIYVDTGTSAASDTAKITSSPGVTDSGTVDAGQGSVALAAGDIYSVAISHTGSLRGRDIRIQGQGRGDVVVDGKIDVSSTKKDQVGGYAEVTGERVGLTANAMIDASGTAGGGTILVGGDTHGANAGVRNAGNTIVLAGAALKADATESGNGGKVVVWSDNTTYYGGSIFARGAGAGGNGGFAEISGKELVFRGSTDMSAPAGRVGNVLLDPLDLTISNAPDNNTVSTVGPPPTETDPSGTPSNLSWASIVSVLATSDLTVSTASSTGPETGTISVLASPLAGTYNTAHALTLATDGPSMTASILVTAPMVNLGTGAITLRASGGVVLKGVSGTVIVGTKGDLNIHAFQNLTGTGTLQSGTTIGITLSDGSSVGTLTIPVVTDTPNLSVLSTGAYIVNTHDTGVSVSLTTPVGGGTFDITSKDALGLVDAPMTILGGGTFDSLRLTGSDITVSGTLIPTSLTLGNSGVLTYPAISTNSSRPATLTFENSGNVGTAVTPLDTYAPSIFFNKTGGNAYVNFITPFSGTVTIQGNSPTGLIFLQASYGSGRAPIVVGADGINANALSLSGESILLTGNIRSATTSITHTFDVNGAGVITATSGVTFSGSGTVAATSTPINLVTPTLTLAETNGDVNFKNNLDAGFTVSGTAAGLVSIVSRNTLDTLTAPLTIAPGNFVSSDSINLTASSINLIGGVSGPQVTFSNDAAITGTGIVTAPSNVFLNGNGNVGSSAAPINTNTPFVEIAKDLGAVFINNGSNDLTLVVDAFTGGGAFTSGAFDLSAAIDVSRNNDFTVNATGALNLNSFPINARTLTLNHNGVLSNYSSGNYTADTIVLSGSGDDGTASVPFLINAGTLTPVGPGTLVLSKTGSANVFVRNLNDTGLILSGTTSSTNVITSFAIDGRTPAPLISGAPGFIASLPSTLTSSTLQVNGTIDSPTLTLNTGTSTSGTGLVHAATQLTLTGNGVFGASGTPINATTPLVVVNNGNGAVFFNNGSSPLALSPTVFLGDGAFTSGNFVLNGSINVGRSNDFSVTAAGSVNLNNFSINARTLSLSQSGTILNYGGNYSADSVVLSGSGDVGTPAAFFAFNAGASAAGNLTVNKSGGANVYVKNLNDLGLTLIGTTNSTNFISSRGISDTAAAPLTTTSAGFTSSLPTTLTSSTLTVAGTVSSPQLTLDMSGTTAGAGTLQASTQLTLANTGTFGSTTASINTNTPSVVLNKASGVVYLNNGASPLSVTPTAFTAGGAFSSGSFNLLGAMAVGANPLDITTTGALSLNGFSLTGGTVTLTDGGLASGTGLLTASLLNLRGSGDVVFTQTNTPAVVVNKPFGAVTLNNGASNLSITPTVFTGGGTFSGGNLSLLGAVNIGGNTLTLTASGTLNLNSSVVTADTLVLNHDGALLNFAAPVVNTLRLGGAGPDGAPATRFVTSVSNLILGKTGAGDVYIDNHLDTGLTLSGSSTAIVSINSRNAAGAVGVPLALAPIGLLDPTGTVTLDSSTFTGGGDLTSLVFTLNHTGALTKTGTATLHAGARINLNGPGNVGLAASPVFTDTPLLALAETPGAVYISNGVTNLVLSTTSFTGGGTISSGSLTLSNSLNEGSNTLSLNSAGTMNLGTNTVTGGVINFNNGGALTGTGAITATQLNLSGAGSVGATATPLSVHIPTLGVNKSGGAIYIANGTGDLAFTPTLFAGGGLLRSGNLTLLAPINAPGSVVGLTSSGAIDLKSNAITADVLTLWHNGALSNIGSFNVTTLGLGGSGDDGTATAHLVLAVPNLQLRKTGSAGVYIDNRRDLGLTVSGSANAAVVLSSFNGAGTSAAALTVGNGGLNSNGVAVAGVFDLSPIASPDVFSGHDLLASADLANGSVTLTSSGLTLNGGVDSTLITVSNNGPAAGTGTLHAVNQLSLTGTGDVGSSPAPVSANTPSLLINKTSGAVFINNNGSPLALTPTTFTGGGGIASGNFTLLGPINVGTNDISITSTGFINLGAFTVTGGTVSFSNAGVLSGTGLVTASTLKLSNSGDVGTVFTPLPFIGAPQAVIRDPSRPLTGVNIGFFGNIAAINLPSGISGALADVAHTENAALAIQDEPAGTPDSDAPATTKNSRRGGGAAFRSMSARADLLSAAREQLQALGIYARPLTIEERRSRSRKEAVFLSVPEKEQPKESDFEVVDARIDPVALREVLRLAAQTGLTEPGKTRLEQVAHALAGTFTAFSAASPSGEAASFRAWLQNRHDTDATTVLDFVKSMQSTIRQIELLGLTHQEIEVSKTQIFGNILRSQLNADPDFLRALIEDAPRAAAAVLTPRSNVDRLALR